MIDLTRGDLASAETRPHQLRHRHGRRSDDADLGARMARRMTPGWWIIPGAIIGLAMWGGVAVVMW